MAAILNFDFSAGNVRDTVWFLPFLNSAYSKTPRCKFSCFYPEVHGMTEYCHIYYFLCNVLNFAKIEKIWKRAITTVIIVVEY